QLATELGADDVFDARSPDVKQQILDLTHGDGADVLLEMRGSGAAINLGLSAVRNGGTAALLGLPSDNVSLNLAEHIIFKGLTVLGIKGRNMFETWYQTQAMVVAGRIDLKSIITHVMPFEKFADCFALLKDGKAAKIVMTISD